MKSKNPRKEGQIQEDRKTPRRGPKGVKTGTGRDEDSSLIKEAKSVVTEQQPEVAEYVEKVLEIKRVTKVTKGGKKLSFSALVVVGDTKGHVGYASCKANEVAIAIKKSILAAKQNMVPIALKGTTIPHQVIGVCGAAEVLLKPAGDGTGVIASGPVRAVCDGVGIRNILTKSHRSNNPINVVKATMEGLLRLKPYVERKEVLESHASA